MIFKFFNGAQHVVSALEMGGSCGGIGSAWASRGGGGVCEGGSPDALLEPSVSKVVRGLGSSFPG